MNIIRNEALIRRYGRAGMLLSLLALVAMGYGFYLSLQGPEQLNLSLFLLVIGFIMTQISLYLGNRWGRSPRPDEIIDRTLKSLGKKYTLYHYVTPVAHLLVGPAGLWVILPYHQYGTIWYDARKKRWRQKAAGLGHAYMRLFGQEGIGRPELDAAAELRRLRQHLEKAGLNPDEIPLGAALLFYSSKAMLKETAESPYPAFTPEGLKNFILQQAKQHRLKPETLAPIQKALYPESEEDKAA